MASVRLMNTRSTLRSYNALFKHPLFTARTRSITVQTSTLPASQPPGSSSHDPLSPDHPVDDLCIPLGPAPTSTCSSSPIATDPGSLTDEVLLKLHRLSALQPPGPPGSPPFLALKEELRTMVSIVDSVRKVDTSEIDRDLEKEGEVVPDGRIWPEGRGIEINWDKLVQTHLEFLEARKNSIPGVKREVSEEEKGRKAREKEEERRRMEAQEEEARRIVAVGKEGVQIFKRRGIGRRPDEEGVYYAVRRRKRGVGNDQDDDDV